MVTISLLNKESVAEGTMAFWLDTKGTGFTFHAGQNADFYIPQLKSDQVGADMHTFSIASSPHHKDAIMIATRMRDSLFKKTLGELAEGSEIHVSEAMGNMTLHDDANIPAVFLAGGIGITPFHSMIEWATHENLAHNITLFYSNRTLGSAAFHKDLEQWAAQNPSFRYVPTISDAADSGWKGEVGRINAEMLKKYCEDIQAPVYYIAGPPGMVTALTDMLHAAGIADDHIKIESFSGY